MMKQIGIASVTINVDGEAAVPKAIPTSVTETKLALPILSPLFFIIRYVSPLLILVVMLKGLGLF